MNYLKEEIGTELEQEEINNPDEVIDLKILQVTLLQLLTLLSQPANLLTVLLVL